MEKILSSKKAQSFLEYSMLIIVIATALTAMYVYMNRSVNAHLKRIQLELNENKR